MGDKMREMKDSGIEWIGEVPQHWTLQKIATLYQVRNQKVSDKDFSPLSVTMKGILPQLEKVAKTNDGDNRKLVRIGDFAINSRSDRRGSCGISYYDGSVSLINTVLTPKSEMNPKYYNWLFHTVQFADEYYKCGHGIVDDLWTTTWQEMKRIVIPTPPIQEQKVIAEILDKKCEEVDSLIAGVQTQIDTMEQYKRSIITESVTKGLNSTAEMKDSNIQWLGEIPTHWAQHPLYYYFIEHKHKNFFGEENNLLSLSYGKIIRKDINTDEGLLPDNFNSYNIIDKDDIVLRLTDLQNDRRSLRTGIATERGIITSAYLTLRSIKPISAQYFYYLLHAYDLMKVLYNMGSGVRQGLNYEELSKMMLIEPPINEQKAIAEYLNAKCLEIDKCIELKKEQIEKLEDYKKSLIFEYVTGKKEVM